MSQPASPLTETDLDTLLAEPLTADTLAILRAQFCGPEVVDDKLHGAFISKAMRIGRAGGPNSSRSSRRLSPPICCMATRHWRPCGDILLCRKAKSKPTER